MIIPVRCFTCGKVIADKWIPYQRLVASGLATGTALHQLRINKPCCRVVLLSHIDEIDKAIAAASIDGPMDNSPN
jgi:DNA-directed RNA polymerases I, II, and III subunit RPABC5